MNEGPKCKDSLQTTSHRMECLVEKLRELEAKEQLYIK